MARIRTVDPTQYENRVREWDYDMITGLLPGSMPPGNELRDLFGSESAKASGTFNYAGIADPVVDALIEQLAAAQHLKDVEVAARALDRVLLYGYYVIPQWHSTSFRIAYWNKFGRPSTAPKYALGFPFTWWIDQKQESTVEAKQTEAATKK
jgi:microcin C transport system substrate-binding protein